MIFLVYFSKCLASFGAARKYCRGHDISDVLPSVWAACSAQYGFRKSSRPINTRSACSVRIIWSACCAEVIKPTAAVGIEAFLRMFAAKFV